MRQCNIFFNCLSLFLTNNFFIWRINERMQSMRHLLLFTLAMVLISPAICNHIIPANNQLIEYTGRIDFSNPELPSFSYSGVSIRTCFIGRNISITWEEELGENYYYVIIDDSIISKIKPDKGINTYLMASGLTDTIHEIEIFKLTEQMFGKATFRGFELDENSKLTEIQNSRLTIEFIGNSITCGYGNEGTLGDTFDPSTENHYMTYAAITSRNFNARNLAVCKSGIGIYRNYDGPAEGNIDCMPNYYDRIYLYNEFPKYNFANTPDLICINLGTNDFSTKGGDSARYVSSYLKFIDQLQSKYNNPEIICLLGPMVNGVTLENLRIYLNYIVETANKNNKGKLHFFEMSEQKGDLGIGTDYHPTIEQHKKNAAELTTFIRSIKGW